MNKYIFKTCSKSNNSKQQQQQEAEKARRMQIKHLSKLNKKKRKN